MVKTFITAYVNIGLFFATLANYMDKGLNFFLLILTISYTAWKFRTEYRANKAKANENLHDRN